MKFANSNTLKHQREFKNMSNAFKKKHLKEIVIFHDDHYILYCILIIKLLCKII